MLEKTITINLVDSANVAVVAVGCDGQDLYSGLCSLIAHIKHNLKDSMLLETVVLQAMADVENMPRNF